MHRRQAHGVHRVHVEPELDAELDGLEQCRLPFVGRLIELPVHPAAAIAPSCRQMSRCSGPRRASARASSPSITGERSGDERRLTGEVDPRQRGGDAQEVVADRRHFLRPRVRIGAAIEQHLNQLETARDRCCSRTWRCRRPCCVSRRPPTAPCGHTQSTALMSAALNQVRRDIRVVVVIAAMSGVMSFASRELISAPASSSIRAVSIRPSREAYISGVIPPGVEARRPRSGEPPRTMPMPWPKPG